jgi:TP901 family phage tail tape measure protein
MPATSEYTFKITLEGKDAVAAARQIRSELEKELGKGFNFQQAKQQMSDVADLSRTTGANVAAVASGMGQATQQGDKLVYDMRQADDATRQMVSELFRSGASAQQLEQALRGGKAAVEETRKEIKWLGHDLQDVASMGRLERIGQAMAAASRQTFGMQMFAGGVERVGTMAMATGAAIIGPLTVAGKSYLEFADDAERAARQLKLNADLTAELKDETLDLSSNLGLFTSEEINQGLYTWASAIGAVAESSEDLNKLMQDSTEIQKLAAMNQESLGTTTEYVAGILGEFGMNTDQTNRTVSVLNYTADRTQATVSDLGQSFKFIGPVAASLGEDIESVAAAMGVAADAGIKGSMSGRALRQLYIRLVKPTADMNEAFNEALGLSEDLGQSWEDIVFPKGEFVGMASFIDLVAAASENMTKQQRQTLLAQMATANELPTLTALVTKQIEARKEGINVLRAEEKIMTGAIDAEVQKYAEWKEATEGITVSLEDARESWEREWQMYEDSDVARADRIQKRWDAAWKRIGEAAVESALPPLEKLAALMDEIGRYVGEHPEAVGAALKTGAILTGIGAFIMAAGKGIRLYADIKMISAATTMYMASENMLKAAGIQATSSQGMLAGLGGVAKVLGYGVAGVAGLEIGARAVGAVRGEEMGAGEALAEMSVIFRELGATIAGIGGAAAAGILGEDPAQAYVEATYEAGRLFGLIEETTTEIEGWEYELLDATDEMNSLKEAERDAKHEASALGNELAQLPEAVGDGLQTFSDAELEAIDELESYLMQRDEMIKEHNQDLADMEADFLEEEAEHYQEYLDERADLQRELAEISSEPLWRQSEDVQKSLKRQAEAYEDYQEKIEEITAKHQRKLRNLREDHDDKMEDLEAARDAKGILTERRRYTRAVRDAEESKDDQLAQQKERLEETLENEREKIATMREERKADLEEKLRELDENYHEEKVKRQEAFDEEYADKQAQHVRDLYQLRQNHAERLAAIMGWEDQVREELRRKYEGREEDLRAHLSKMRSIYADIYDVTPQAAMSVEEYRSWHEQVRGHQTGGYASGVYRLGEAGREFVLSAPTTRALERAAGYLTQEKMVAMAGGSSGGYFRMDINVTADDHFSPAFAAQTEALVQAEIVKLSQYVTQGSQPGAYRPH